MIWIGIDCGAHTGLAVWDSEEQRFTRIETVKLHQALTFVLHTFFTQDKAGVAVVFEDARKRHYLPRERNLSEYRGKLMGAGSVKRDATIWEEFLTDYKIPFIAQAPASGATKWKADYFARVTGWTGKTSEHARDAALLVFQRKNEKI